MSLADLVPIIARCFLYTLYSIVQRAAACSEHWVDRVRTYPRFARLLALLAADADADSPSRIRRSRALRSSASTCPSGAASRTPSATRSTRSPRSCASPPPPSATSDSPCSSTLFGCSPSSSSTPPLATTGDTLLNRLRRLILFG